MPLINCEVILILTWSANYVVVSNNVGNQVATFTITQTKIYVPVVALSTQDNTKCLAIIRIRIISKKSRFKSLSRARISRAK